MLENQPSLPPGAEPVRNDTAAQALERLRSIEPLAQLGRMSAGIAHELRNPLGLITNFATLQVELVSDLLESLGTAERSAEIAELTASIRENALRIEEHGRRAENIIREVLAHARGEKAERTETDVNVLVSTYASLSYHALRARRPEAAVDVRRRRLDPEVGSLTIARGPMGRALVNLLDNAFDAVAGQSQATVDLQTAIEGDRVAIRVSDSGTGIAEENVSRIFEPFYSSKAEGGTGLGLAIARDIAREHGGDIDVVTREGAGTTFILWLPLSLRS
ncbi:hypothetical protein BH23BAC4_BH23BAC4_16610 [soil metagenome]